MEEKHENHHENMSPDVDDCIELSDILNTLKDSFLWIKNNQIQINNVVKGICSSISEIQAIMEPLSRFALKIHSTFQSASPILQELSLLGVASEKLGARQFVLWQHLSVNDLKKIHDGVDIDRFIEDHISFNNYGVFNEIIVSLVYEDLLVSSQVLFKQSLQAYQSGNFNLAVVGLTSIIDGLLSKVSKSTKTNMMVRCESILKNIDEGVYFKSEEYAVVTLIYTFWLTIESFSKTIDFADVEPTDLNRHWIMHGRSTRDYSRTDCIKLINIIYAIVLINGSKQIDNYID